MKMSEQLTENFAYFYSEYCFLLIRVYCGKNCICPPGSARNCDQRRAVPGSISFVPSVVGLIMAGEVVRDLTGAKVEVSA